MFSVLGFGVFNTDGDMWRFHRSMTRPFFTRDRIRDFDIFDRHANTVLNLIKERMRSGNAMDFQDLMSRFTLDSASEFLFGIGVHSLAAGIPYPHNATSVPSNSVTSQAKHANEFAAAFLQVQEVIARRFLHGSIWPLMEIFEDKTKKSMEIVRAYLDPIIKEAVVKNANNAKNVLKGEGTESYVDEGETLIDHLVRLSSDPVVLRDETLNIMIAGRDTTASTLTFIIYCLAMYPTVHARLREEVLDQVGPTKRPDFDDIKDMKYLRAVINETLRLFPTVPFNTRENIKATIWPSHDPAQKSIYIPAGTQLIYSVFIMHRRKDLWGPDADEFDPDRFLDDRLKRYLKNSFIFLPFNAGPRICLGQQFAYNEISFMLIRFIQQFTSVSLDEAASPPQAKPPAHWAEGVGRKTIERVYPKWHLTMYAQGGLWVRMTGAEPTV
ncbi:Cytochrome P450 52E1 [Termitomyces sp. T112]|nr:Cytochrome P450 52E1 [Termitomyces sp. T112]